MLSSLPRKLISLHSDSEYVGSEDLDLSIGETSRDSSRGEHPHLVQDDQSQNSHQTVKSPNNKARLQAGSRQSRIHFRYTAFSGTYVDPIAELVPVQPARDQVHDDHDHVTEQKQLVCTVPQASESTKGKQSEENDCDNPLCTFPDQKQVYVCD
jgi:hypothetical protein